MKRNTNATCATCPSFLTATGECRSRPPLLHFVGGELVSAFPVISNNGWCARHPEFNLQYSSDPGFMGQDEIDASDDNTQTISGGIIPQGLLDDVRSACARSGIDLTLSEDGIFFLVDKHNVTKETVEQARSVVENEMLGRN